MSHRMRIFGVADGAIGLRGVAALRRSRKGPRTARTTARPGEGREIAPTLVSALTCPNCGAVSAETMPTDACIHFFECPGCHDLLEPEPGDCCVFCSYGTIPCPPVQESRSSRCSHALRACPANESSAG